MRLALVCAVGSGFSGPMGVTHAEAALKTWKDCREVLSNSWLGFLFPSPPANGLERLPLPRVVRGIPERVSYSSANGYRNEAIRFLENAVGTKVHWADLRRLANEVGNAAQFMVFRVLVQRDSPMSSPLAKRLHEFHILEQGGPPQVFRNVLNEFTDQDVDGFLAIQNHVQLEFYLLAILASKSPVNLSFAQNYILPRISTEAQLLALEHIIEYGRGKSDGMLRLALHVSNDRQLELIEFLLDQNAVDSVFEAVFKVRTREDALQVRNRFLEHPSRIPEPDPKPYRNATDPLVFLHHFGVTRWNDTGQWHRMFRSIKLEPENRLQWFYKWPGMELSEHPLGRRRELRSNKADARKKADFYRNIYLQLNNGKYNGVNREKFDNVWLNVLWDEDRHLPQERMVFFEFSDVDHQTLAFFGLFDGSRYVGEPTSLIPALQKHPEVEAELMKRITAQRGGKPPKHIFEWRRLAIRRGDANEPQDKIRLPEAEQTVIAYLKRFGFKDAVVIGHTDSFGLKTFSEKTHLKPILSAQELVSKDGKVPDEYILWMDIDSIP